MVDWAELGVTVMRDARKRKGYSYETMGRELRVVAKTYERYEKAGRVPRHLLPRVAEVLDLEIEEAQRERVIVKAPAGRVGDAQLYRLETELAEVRRELQELRAATAGISRIEELLREPKDLTRDEPAPA